jgi:hypothetical protein
VRIAAERAELALTDVVAELTEPQLVLDVQDRLDQPLRVFPRSAEYVKSQPLRGLLPDPGEPLELLDKA